jgi:hypothetical protein
MRNFLIHEYFDNDEAVAGDVMVKSRGVVYEVVA